MHLKLNGLGLREAQVLHLVGKGIARSRSLVGVHMNGNQITEESPLHARLCQVLGIRR